MRMYIDRDLLVAGRKAIIDYHTALETAGVDEHNLAVRREIIRQALVAIISAATEEQIAW